MEFRVVFSSYLILFLIHTSTAQSVVADTSATRYFELAEAFYAKNKSDSAVFYYAKSAYRYAQTASESDSASWQAASQAMYYAAFSLSQKSEYERAEILLDSAYQICELHLKSESPTHAVVLGGYGNLFYNTSDYKKSLDYYFKALKITSHRFGTNHAKTANVYNNIGLVYRSDFQFDNAIQYYSEALKVYQKIYGEDHSNVAVLYNNFGITYLDAGKYDDALDFLEKSLKIRIKLLGEKHALIARTFYNMAICFLHKKEYFKAQEYFEKALTIRLAVFGEKHSDIAHSYTGLGAVAQKMGNFDKSLDYFFKAADIQIALLGNLHNDLAITYNDIGITYMELNELEKARLFQEKSLFIRVLVFGENNIKSAENLNNLGLVYEEMKDYKTALHYYNSCLSLRLNYLGDKHPLTASVYCNIGSVYRKMSDFENALLYYKNAAESSLLQCEFTYNETVTDISTYSNHHFLLQALQARAEILAELHPKSTPEIVLNHYFAADTLIGLVRAQLTEHDDKLLFAQSADKLYNSAIHFCISRELFANAFAFSEKAKNRILFSDIELKRMKLELGLSAQLIERETLLSKQFAFFQIKSAEATDSAEVSEMRTKMFDAKRNLDAFNDSVQTKFPEIQNLKLINTVPRVSDLQNVIDDKTLILSYTVADSLLFIHQISKSDFTVSKSDAHDLKKSIARYLIALHNSDKSNNKNIAELSKYLSNTLLPKNIDAKIEKLIIIPDDSLNLLPFETLLYKSEIPNLDDFGTYPFLIQKYAVSYAPSATLFHKLRTQNRLKTNYDALIFAPVFSENDSLVILESDTYDENTHRSFIYKDPKTGKYVVKPLVYSETEAREIFKLFGKRKSKLYLHAAATEANYKSAELANFNVLHLATHALADANMPERSGILFSQNDTIEDGFLFVPEIYLLKLNADLVTLSACETAAGKVSGGEGVLDISRAFFSAGASNVLSTLWQTEDRATADLMREFYRSYENGSASTLSLQTAKRKLLHSENQKYRHPKFWAPFVLIGK